MNSQVLQTLRAVQECEDEERRVGLMARTNARLSAHFSHPGNRSELEELAYDVLNTTWSDTMTDNIVNQVIEVKTIGLNDPDYVNEDLRGMRAYWQGKGGEIESDVIRTQRASMPKEEMVGAIDLHVDDIKSDFWGKFSKLVEQAREKFTQLPVERLIQLVQQGVTDTSYYGTFAAATLTDSQVDPLIDNVAARSKGRLTILATRVGVRKLSAIGLDFGQIVQNEIFRTGVIAIYKGFSVVEVENFEDFVGNLVLPDDEVWLVGQQAGRLTYYGAEAKVQQLPLPAFQLRWETARDAGMLLYGAQKGRIGRIKLV